MKVFKIDSGFLFEGLFINESICLLQDCQSSFNSMKQNSFYLQLVLMVGVPFRQVSEFVGQVQAM